MKPWQTSFFSASQSLWMVTAAMKLKGTCSLEEKLWKHWQHVKEQRHHFTNKGSYCQSYGFFRQSSTDVNVWAQRRLSTKDLILFFIYFYSVQFSSVTQSCPTLCDPINRSLPGLPVHHQLPEFIQNSCPSSQWCYAAISPSVVPFSSCKVLEFQL